MENVALLAVGVMQQREVRAAVRVVLDGRHFRGHAQLVAPEVHVAVGLLMAAAAVPDHDFAVIVAPAGALFRLHQRLFRLLLGDVALVHDGDKPPRRRIWIKALQSHRCLLPSYLFLLRSLIPLGCPCHPERKRRISTMNRPSPYKFSAYSIIFSPSASFTYA